MRVGRNESCPCGSGKKFKACCAGKQTRSRGLVLLLAMIGAIAAVGVVASIRKDEKPAPIPAPVARTTPKAQPPGPVPAGKVWSVEHGHWHDAAAPKAATTTSPIQITGAPAPGAPARTPKPQPPGPAPAGQVWSAEHGHWHDARTP